MVAADAVSQGVVAALAGWHRTLAGGPLPTHAAAAGVVRLTPAAPGLGLAGFGLSLLPSLAAAAVRAAAPASCIGDRRKKAKKAALENIPG